MIWVSAADNASILLPFAGYPCRTDPNRAANYSSAYGNGNAANVEYLSVKSPVIDHEIALRKCGVDRVGYGLAGGFRAAVLPNERVETVSRFAEDVMPPIRVVHDPDDRYPFGRPSTRSPMMLRWISLVPPAIVYCRAPRTRWNQRSASGTASVGSSIVA